jgi:hypothetical protein
MKGRPKKAARISPAACGAPIDSAKAVAASSPASMMTTEIPTLMLATVPANSTGCERALATTSNIPMICSTWPRFMTAMVTVTRPSSAAPRNRARASITRT